jgi:hypothetical protein
VSGGTAIAAGVLALLLGVFRLWQTYGYFVTMSMFSGYDLPGTSGIRTYVTVEAFASAFASLALIVGGVMLLSRRSAGPGWVTFGALVVIADAAITWAAIYGLLDTMFDSWLQGWSPSSLLTAGPLTFVVLGISIGVPLLTLILARVASTRRWCEARSGPGNAVPGAY